MGLIETITAIGVVLAIAEAPVLVGLACIVGFALLCVAMGIS